MSQAFQAIYENGILRLIQPLDLPENSPVHGVIASDAQPVPDETLLKQQQALDAMQDKLNAAPQTATTDGLTGRDHDSILYGQQQ